ncbi:hypothetical protein UFOVP1361_7 [uncultured Caudovirales phage]|uniref:Uncharacterized protein n=1 Tax=uncultured Caudovirales phage TaxID=2100421 RepID=A0A6J5S184_9CAUD|nr:hypothetical protein UFOVP1361_7 [uncultured Caudovirales phage]
MSKEKILVQGVYVKEFETKYGIIYNLSLDVQTLNEFARKHGNKSEKNGKVYLNIDMLRSREDKPYFALNQYKKPEKQAEADPFEDDIPF